jgi:hypothetical protein
VGKKEEDRRSGSMDFLLGERDEWAGEEVGTTTALDRWWVSCRKRKEV